MKRIQSPLLAVLLLTAFPAGVFAHAVGVSCTPRGGQFEVEGYYDDDTPAVKARVRVLNAKGVVVAAGVTDEKGRWTFARPGPGQYEVQLDAGAGHRKAITLSVNGVSSEPPPIVAPTAEPIGAGPTRSEFTSIPWLKILIGFAVIGCGCGALLLASRLRATARQGVERRSPSASG